MLTSAPVSIEAAQHYGVVGKIEQAWRARQLQRGVLSLDTINSLINDWKEDRIKLLLPEKDLTVIAQSVTL